MPIWIRATPWSKARPRRRPKERMSRLKPGYFTCFSEFLMSSTVTVQEENAE